MDRVKMYEYKVGYLLIKSGWWDAPLVLRNLAEAIKYYKDKIVCCISNLYKIWRKEGSCTEKFGTTVATSISGGEELQKIFYLQ